MEKREYLRKVSEEILEVEEMFSPLLKQVFCNSVKNHRARRLIQALWGCFNEDETLAYAWAREIKRDPNYWISLGKEV